MSEEVILDTINEQSLIVIQCDWTDENGDAVTPSSAKYTLVDRRGNVINSIEDEAISSLSTTNYITLYGDDTAVLAAEEDKDVVIRRLIVFYTYSSDLVTSKETNSSCIIKIRNFKYIQLAS